MGIITTVYIDCFERFKFMGIKIYYNYSIDGG